MQNFLLQILFRIKKSKCLSKSVNWWKYNIVSPEKYYFLDTIKFKRISATWKHFNMKNVTGTLGNQALYFWQRVLLKNAPKLRFHMFLENIWYRNFTWNGLIQEKLWFLVQIMGRWGLKLSGNKIHNFSWNLKNYDTVLLARK